MLYLIAEKELGSHQKETITKAKELLANISLVSSQM
jgi:hypothetical protein